MVTIDRLMGEPRLMHRWDAVALCEQLNTTEDACGWSYRVVPAHIPPLYHIEVRDEEGYILGHL